ncbi:hypothetical protein LTR05_005814 [Lithohypha guttulata]|uniref:RRM domain-containing protein n=1 Tax=Lithohypha guttulata TaxID=1690604 RepID=A0AAN7SZG0_9EURO|nr:hypothetical protein LTR05_005814 [Lithohypha guttulata]
MGKRKREAEAQTADTTSAKKQATESGISAAERRQQRSERKSKKAQESKQNAGTKKLADDPEVVGANQTGDDSFAIGDDFVSLDDTLASTKSSEPKRKPTVEENATTSTSKSKRKSPRSERKAAREVKAQSSVIEEHGPAAPDPANANATETKSKAKSKDGGKETNTSRFIVFVGNLPFTTTTAQIQQHFRKLSPASIRHSTDKNSGKSRGFAFLEFEDYSAMKTCLKVYHHSLFDPVRTAKLPDSAFDENGLEIEKPGQDKKSRGRRINVELTAGGGGKGGQRQDKIKKKNEKLWEERERRKKEDVKKEKKKRLEKGNERSEANSTEIGSEAVHPSRTKRVNAA